jgi:hypothetical protein
MVVEMSTANLLVEHGVLVIGVGGGGVGVGDLRVVRVPDLGLHDGQVNCSNLAPISWKAVLTQG